MGDPADPSTPYRVAFVNMMTAMGKEKRKTAQKEGEKCIAIARENEKMNPHWKIQEVVVQLALANDEIRHKDYEGARKRTDKAVEAATPLPEELGDSMGKPVLAQAYMARASFACYPEKWKEAMPDFEEAARLYQEAKNELMAIEAYRMAGFCANRAGWKDQSLEYLVAGFQIATQTNRESLKASSFSALLRQLIDKNYKKHLSPEEVSTIATELYGEDWQEIIKSIWKKAPDVCTYWEEEETVLPVE
ncbi:MAG: hypothetical protein LUD74_07810 [Tannerellaceae bacterium]|nr:hypothetical protein [Tannerellaceae bacterium]